MENNNQKQYPVWEIVRSYSRKVQVAQYEPRDYFCSVKEVFYEIPSKELIEARSEQMDAFCKYEVHKSITSDLKILNDAKEGIKNAKGIKAEKKEKSAEEGLEDINAEL